MFFARPTARKGSRRHDKETLCPVCGQGRVTDPVDQVQTEHKGYRPWSHCTTSCGMPAALTLQEDLQAALEQFKLIAGDLGAEVTEVA